MPIEHLDLFDSGADSETLGALAPDTAGQLDIFRHDGHPLGVDGAEVGVLEQTHQVSLASLLQN